MRSPRLIVAHVARSGIRSLALGHSRSIAPGQGHGSAVRVYLQQDTTDIEARRVGYAPKFGRDCKRVGAGHQSGGRSAAQSGVP